MSEDLRILMVEDQEADAILIQRELRRQGLTFTVRRVTRDAAMIRALHDFAPDLVLSDFALPGFSGLEALAILRKECPGVPLIFVSGTVGEEQAVELLKLGATDYVLKQNLARLPASINRALREVQLERERRQTEEQYRSVVQKMEALASPIGQVGAADYPTSKVAHDLNNILAPIFMTVSMLRGGLPEAERERMLSIIENSARRASEIVREVAALSQWRNREGQPLEMSRVIKEVFQKLQNTWPENLRVKLAVEDDLWRVTGDAIRIEQVIRDLCIHARDAMPGGGTLRLNVRNQVWVAPGSNPPGGAKPGPYVVLEVSDTGPDARAETGRGGLANDLAAVQSIVNRHDGFVQVINSPGEGTTFKVFLPAAVEAQAAILATSPPARLPAAAAGKCVLLVDDEETIRFAAKAVLSKNGYRVLAARDGTDALKVFHAHADEIALVLTDVMMPVMDGMALIRALRQERPEILIVASSGQNEKTRLAELQRMGVGTVLNKPYAADILLQTVSQVLSQHGKLAVD